jgi:hypothetical protein
MKTDNDGICVTEDSGDRRRSSRFALRLAVKYKQMEPAVALDGNCMGETVNISSSGLLFRASEAVDAGQFVKASIDWPARLNDNVRLTLVVEGPVVRKIGDHAAMRIEKYEFRTRGPAERRLVHASKRQTNTGIG